MGDEYQLRKDIDKIERDHSELNNKVSKSVFFADNSPLHEYGTTRENTGTLDGILDVLIAESGGGDLTNYYTKTEINGILSSYVTISFANSTYAPIVHTHSQYITRDEISDLDINLTTLDLVPYEDNPNGVMCFDRVQKTIDELDIDLKADTMSNGYLKIEVDLIEVTRSVNDGNNS